MRNLVAAVADSYGNLILAGNTDNFEIYVVSLVRLARWRRKGGGEGGGLLPGAEKSPR